MGTAHTVHGMGIVDTGACGPCGVGPRAKVLLAVVKDPLRLDSPSESTETPRTWANPGTGLSHPLPKLPPCLPTQNKRKREAHGNGELSCFELISSAWRFSWDPWEGTAQSCPIWAWRGRSGEPSVLVKQVGNPETRNQSEQERKREGFDLAVFAATSSFDLSLETQRLSTWAGLSP